MFSLDAITLTLILVAAAGTAGSALWLKSLIFPRPGRNTLAVESGKALVLLFVDDTLVDATRPGRILMATGIGASDDLDRLADALSDRFPRLKSDLAGLEQGGHIEIPANDPQDACVMEAEMWHDRLRIELRNFDDIKKTTIDMQCLRALETEVSILRGAAEHAPCLMWQCDGKGQVSWANAAYLALADTMNTGPDGAEWPPANLFPDPYRDNLKPGPRRIALTTPGTGDALWFEYHSPDGVQGIRFALPINEEVAAEVAHRDFVQTLTKTFAHLPTGLAIFDRDRRLVLFNPVLTNLTTLPVDFLSAKPHLSRVIDALRDRRMIPEPRNYKAWRDKLLRLETGIIDDGYEETWSLPTGRTYRIKGRPFPNGAIAFQFDDITSEISLTRNFRSELELGQAVIDSFPQAIAVFGRDGSLTISNDAYAALWGYDPTTSIMALPCSEAARHWAEASAPSPVWDRIVAFSRKTRDRSEWRDIAELRDGRMLRLRVAPLTGGATLVGFECEAPHPVAAISPPAQLAENP